MDIVLKRVERIVVFLHPGQLNGGVIFPVTLLDCDSDFNEQLEKYKNCGAIQTN